MTLGAALSLSSFLVLFFLFLIVQLRFTFHIILYQPQVYSTVVNIYTLHKVVALITLSPTWPHTIITILSTTFCSGTRTLRRHPRVLALPRLQHHHLPAWGQKRRLTQFYYQPLVVLVTHPPRSNYFQKEGWENSTVSQWNGFVAVQSGRIQAVVEVRCRCPRTEPLPTLLRRIYSLRVSSSLKGISQSVSKNSLKDIFPHKVWKAHKTFITVVAVGRTPH